MTDKLGTFLDDTIFAFNGEDAYALQGNDTLYGADFATVGMVGGVGNDSYVIGHGGITTILENGNSPNDVFIENPNDIYYDLVYAQVDGRHFVAYDRATGASLVIVDWQLP